MDVGFNLSLAESTWKWFNHAKTKKFLIRKYSMDQHFELKLLQFRLWCCLIPTDLFSQLMVKWGYFCRYSVVYIYICESRFTVSPLNKSFPKIDSVSEFFREAQESSLYILFSYTLFWLWVIEPQRCVVKSSLVYLFPWTFSLSKHYFDQKY